MALLILNMKKLVTFLFFTVFILSCTVDFNPETGLENECVVIQSCLQPDSTVTVRLYASIAEGGKMKIIPLENAHVSLKENDVVIYDGISDAVLKPDIYPKAGKTYSITAVHEKHPAVTAENCIPEPVKFEATYLGDDTYRLFGFESAETAFPLWITSSVLMSDTPPSQYTFLFTYNLLVDNFNRME